MSVTADELLGRWSLERGAPCAAEYPPTIELRPHNAYLAPEGPHLGSRWHGGGWRLENGATLVMQAPNDADLRYRIVAADPVSLTVEDAEGCLVTYRRTD